MCGNGKHDDSSNINVAEIVADEEYAMKMYNHSDIRVNIRTSIADEYLRYIGDGCDYDCYTRTMLLYPFTSTHVHNWNNHTHLWNKNSEQFAEAVRGANKMRREAFDGWAINPRYADEVNRGVATHAEKILGIPTQFAK
jgi:hypothetical protein